MKTALVAVGLATIFLIADCAAPQPDPYVMHVMQQQALLEQRKAELLRQKAEIEKMPPGEERQRAEDRWYAEKAQLLEDNRRLGEGIDRERQTRALESMAESQRRMAEPQPTPYVIPTPIQVQIVPQY